MAMIGDTMIVGPMVAAGQGDESVPDDASLMASFAAGDGPAFEALYRRHRVVLYNYIRRLTPPSVTDEIFQDVWMAVVKSRSQYVPVARFTTFLFAIAHRRIADFYRRRRPQEALSEELRDEASDPAAMAQNAALGAALSAAVGQLPHPQREAFLLRAEWGSRWRRSPRSPAYPMRPPRADCVMPTGSCAKSWTPGNERARR